MSLRAEPNLKGHYLGSTLDLTQRIKPKKKKEKEKRGSKSYHGPKDIGKQQSLRTRLAPLLMHVDREFS